MSSVFTRGRGAAPRQLAVGVAAAVAALVGGLILPGAAGASAAGAATGRAAAVTDPAALVNPFIGTNNNANDFPGPDVPFGMIQWSPDTLPRPDGGGYDYASSKMIGFALAHMSGPGCKVAGDIPVLPTVGAVNPSASDQFSHTRESASAGYYKVALQDGVTAQLTSTTRTGLAQFTFPKQGRSNLVFKLADSQRTASATTFRMDSNTEVSGSATTVNFCGTATPYTIYFDMKFSQPFARHGTYTPKGLQPNASSLSLRAPRAATSAGAPPSQSEPADHPTYHGPQPAGRSLASSALKGPDGAYVTFNTNTAAKRTVTVRVGISYVSVSNARQNLKAEDPAGNFAAVQSAATASWNALLNKVQITGGSAAQQTTFYTALYHTLLAPNVFSDVNGQYRGINGKLHTVPAGHSFYTNISGWDIYRSQAQLETLLDPAAASDVAQSMLDDYNTDHMLPKWPENNAESYIMVGDPADAVLADYYAFGARGFSARNALTDMVHQAVHASDIRPGLSYLQSQGYLPINGRYGCCNYYASVSTTLEYNTADFAISALAGALGEPTVQTRFANRAQDWRNVLDPDSGFDQPREANGAWQGGFTPLVQGPPFAEQDSWNYTGMVPFDVAGLAAAKGGNAAMNVYLSTALRSFNGSSGYANLGNEPAIELPWEYDFTGEPYQTQGMVRQVQDQIWSDRPGGLGTGNDDLGEMSSWYVWSALGMYPMIPGTTTMALGSPVFSTASISLPSGATLTIDGNGAAQDAPYVQSATWNGAAWNDAFAPSGLFTSGGTLAYTLGTSPNTSWAAAPADAPPSYGGDVVAPPDPRTGPLSSAAVSGACLDDKSTSVSNGNQVQVAHCNGSGAQEWTIAPDGTIRVAGKCLEVRSSSKANGAPTDLYSCNGSGAQQWSATASSELVNPESHKCLLDPNSATNTRLKIYRCNGTRDERWTLPPSPAGMAGAIASAVPKLCLDDRSGGTRNGTAVQVAACNGSSPEHWFIDPDGTVRTHGLCLDVTSGKRSSGSATDLYRCNGTGAQSWQMTTAGQLVNTQSGLCLDDPHSHGAGTRVVIFTCGGAAGQHWTFPS
jgi:predicted alpha-1,2-mannosidase